ncbi:MAG: polysaccharide deacetylase family protein [Oscillospiraceae bacterium]|nr:polysaccharide deacetylase family protein [Oscillospiraceae bacterium]
MKRHLLPLLLTVLLLGSSGCGMQTELPTAEEETFAVLTDPPTEPPATEPPPITEEPTTEPVLVRVEDPAETPHIFFHSLIYDPDLAFDNDGEDDGYNIYMTTVQEFRTILDQLYENDYVLVRQHDIATETEDGFVPGDIYLPEGKKPVIISQDDVNYYNYMTGDGFATRLVVRNGKVVCEYTDKGKTMTGAYDLVPILDEFVEAHPDFSYNGAKAVIAVTGYEGVFGYRAVDNPDSPDFEKECKEASAVADALRNSGYEIASHSYGHINFTKSSYSTIEYDTNRWEERIGSVVGGSDILIYPYGADITSNIYHDAYEDTEKFRLLYNHGFRYFLNVDNTQDAWVQLNTRYVRQARRNLDGFRLYYYPEKMKDLMRHPEAVLDDHRPQPVPKI